MTNKEAIKFLKEPRMWEWLNVAQQIALDMAIDALSQEPCEDAISREDALMCMTGEYIADMTYKPEDIISKHIQRLRALPSVQPIRPKGHWIQENQFTNPKCSNCNELNDYKSDFCPDCGARMIEPQAESEDKG